MEAIAQWKFLYIELAQEYQQYKAHCEASMKKDFETEKEKVRFRSCCCFYWGSRAR